MTDYYAYDAGLPCKNPNCKSHGMPHPNCQCYGGGSEHRSGQGEYAHGGRVCAEGLAHDPDCQYFLDGGDVQSVPAPMPLPPDDIHNTLGMAGVHHGLLGLLSSVGHSKLAEPEKHAHVLHDLKAQHEWAKSPEKEPLPKRLGNKLALHLQNQDFDQASETIHGHPLVGGAAKGHLKPILHRMAHPLMTHEAHPEALRSSVDYLHSSLKGQSDLDAKMGRLLGPEKSEPVKEDKDSREKLKKQLDSIHENPTQLLDLGGSLGHYLPEHSSGLAYQAAQAVQYLSGLKPKPQQLAPLDTEESIDKMDQATYDRQIDIAQSPLLVLHHVREGTVVPQDLTTLKTIYPGLYQSMTVKATEQLIEAKTKNIEIPYKQKMGLSLLLGQPLDFTQSPMALQAVMKANGVAQSPQMAQPKGKSQRRSGATGPELKQIDKVDRLSETTLEARQINKLSR